LALRRLSSHLKLLIFPAARGGGLPACFLGGWVGYAAYDTVRYAEPAKLAHAPIDDRGLPELHFGFYDGVVVFDHVDKLVHLIELAIVAPDGDAGEAYDTAAARLAKRVDVIQRHSKPLPAGIVETEAGKLTPVPSNTTRDQHAAMVAKAKALHPRRRHLPGGARAAV
jgi:anthranilate synthase component 1